MLFDPLRHCAVAAVWLGQIIGAGLGALALLHPAIRGLD